MANIGEDELRGNGRCQLVDAGSWFDGSCLKVPIPDSPNQLSDHLNPVITIFSSNSVSCSVMSNFLQPHGLWPTRLLCPWDSPDNSTGVDCHFLLQGIFPTQGSNPGLPHCRQMLYHLSHQGNEMVALNNSFCPVCSHSFEKLQRFIF